MQKGKERNANNGPNEHPLMTQCRGMDEVEYDKVDEVDVDNRRKGVKEYDWTR